VCLSDGGHFDNMGLYELVRRRCKYIILSDAEGDENAICEGLANAIRRCRIDFGVEIKIGTEPITDKDKKYRLQSEAHRRRHNLVSGRQFSLRKDPLYQNDINQEYAH